jgi:hypothetical protein
MGRRMAKFRIAAVLLTLSLFDIAVTQSFATESVAVVDRSESVFNQAIREAFSSLLIRATGDRNIINQPAVKEAFTEATRWVSLYQYEDDEDGTELRVQFDEAMVLDLLRSAGATYWTQARPPLLLWLVIDEPEGRRFATLDQDAMLLDGLRSTLAERGVALRTPVLDLQDALQLAPEDVWKNDVESVRAASQRYGTPHIVLGRWVTLGGGFHIADWLYLEEDREQAIQVQGLDEGRLIDAAAEMAMNRYLERYAMALSNREAERTVLVNIRGVRAVADYTAVLSVLDDIALVDHVQLTAMAGDVLTFRVSGVETTSALARLLPEQSRLSVIADAMSLADPLELAWEAQ